MQDLRTNATVYVLEARDTQKSSISDLLAQLHGVENDADVLVDFDETLLLRNSTEEYLNTLQPRAVGVFFLAFLDYLKPWYWLPGRWGGEVSRDWLRVLLATILFPWTLLIWPWHAKKLAQNYQNKVLVEALQNNSHLNSIVATDGFYPIVAPILKHIPLAEKQLYACRFWLGGVDRLLGKLQRLNQALGARRVAASVVITDSPNDKDLLRAAKFPHLVQWPDAAYKQAMTRAYAPFLYVVKFKHNPTYLLHGILMDQWLMLVLASSWIATRPLFHAAGLLCLVFSFWCIYELGYYENDYVAQCYEKNPNLKSDSIDRPDAPVVEPWIWAGLSAVPGLLLLQWSTLTESPLGLSFSVLEGVLPLGLGWAVILLATRLVYWIFNHIDKRSRVWLYLPLQYSRLPVFALLTPISPVGMALLSAQTLTSWVRYIVYRYHGKMKEVPHAILRLVTLIFLVMMLLSVNSDIFAVVNWQMAAIVGFCFLRTLSTLPTLIRQASMVTDDDWSPLTSVQ
ncbi:MAG: HAD family hydrolase [Cyanobacteria bacterium P01_D01_bin.56]